MAAAPGRAAAGVPLSRRMTPARLTRLPRQPLQPPLHLLDARRAATPHARLLGLALLAPDAVWARTALLLPRTR